MVAPCLAGFARHGRATTKNGVGSRPGPPASFRWYLYGEAGSVRINDTNVMVMKSDHPPRSRIVPNHHPFSTPRNNRWIGVPHVSPVLRDMEGPPRNMLWDRDLGHPPSLRRFFHSLRSPCFSNQSNLSVVTQSWEYVPIGAMLFLSSRQFATLLERKVKPDFVLKLIQSRG